VWGTKVFAVATFPDSEVYVVSHVETMPLNGRRRLMFLSPGTCSSCKRVLKAITHFPEHGLSIFLPFCLSSSRRATGRASVPRDPEQLSSAAAVAPGGIAL